jgi:hypothetical protein
MDQHVRQFAILTVAMSIGGLVIGVLLLIAGAPADALVQLTGAPGLRFVVIAFALFNIAMAIPSLIAANALLKFEGWARDLLIVISALNILNVPFGPLLGAYGLWVLLSVETEPLFLERPHRGGSPPPRHFRDMLRKRFKITAKDQQATPIVPSKADLHP